MIEIRFHGRGGQGAVIASIILGNAICCDGGFSLSTPKFGVERRGAPITAFLRIDNKKISMRYEIKNPDCVVVMDETLIKAPGVGVIDGLKTGGLIIINSPKNPNAFNYLGSYLSIATVDATKIATEFNIGTKTSPIVNTTIIGAIVRVLDIVSMKTVNHWIEKKIDSNVANNVFAAQKAFDTVLF